jgi:hypothetical protein
MPTAPGGDWIERWKRQMPAFLAGVATQRAFGSGLQVDARHVLTCAHVLCAEGPSAYYDDHGDPDARHVVGSAAAVHFGASQIAASVKAQHATLDLALLELASPRHGVAAPLMFRNDFAGGNAQILGIGRDENGLGTRLHTIENLRMAGDYVRGVLTHIKHPLGAMEGSSGGGVFAAHEGTLIFLGVAYLGGERAAIGSFIAAPAVLSFLAQHLDPIETPRMEFTEHQRHLQSIGLAPLYEFRADGPLSLSFVPLLPRSEGGTPRTSFLLSRVLSAREARQGSSSRIMPGHDRLPARAERIADAETVIARLSTAIASPLRLPAVQELEVAWDLASNPQKLPRMPEGRPLKLRDFGTNPYGFDVPPVGLAEWARGTSGAAQAVEARISHGLPQLTVLSASEASSRSPTFRAAFDVSGM